MVISNPGVFKGQLLSNIKKRLKNLNNRDHIFGYKFL